MSKLRITEIFFSLQGETRTVGLPTVFVRLTGCPLRCGYCDTEYAFKDGEWMALEDVVAKVDFFQAQYVTVTGGEPLAQETCLDLLSELCERKYQVSLETSGALDISKVDKRVVKVVDIKTPGSGEVERNLAANFNFINPQDQIKFVICDENDYHWAKDFLGQYKLLERCEILFSPSHDVMDNKQLANWILQDKLPVRFQIQLHKYIWGDVPGK